MKIGTIRSRRKELDIPYGRYVIHIHFNFVKMMFEAYTNKGDELLLYAIDDKIKTMDIISQCLTELDIPHIKAKLEHKYKILEGLPSCYIKFEDFINFLTLTKLKGIEIC